MPREKSKRKVARARAARPFIKAGVGEWQIVDKNRAAELARAYDNGVRRIILELLDEYGPMRKYMVTKRVNRELRRRGEDADYRDVTIQHHLKILEGAGLIGTIPGEAKRSKIVYRAGDIQIQLRRRSRPRKPPEMPAEEERFFGGES